MTLECTKLLSSSPELRPAATDLDGCLVHIYPTGARMGTRYPLGSTLLVLGRDKECQIQIEEVSVSRRHACIRLFSDGYHVLDLSSTNGTFVNKVRVEEHKLNDGDYLRVGNCIYRFLAGDNVEAGYHEELYRLTIIDALTEIHNRRYLLDFLGNELGCANRYQRPLALALFDIDRFKAINDALGHLGGDYVLRELASCVKGTIRKTDLLARFGGEEFAIVMPETTREQALDLAERIRRQVENHPFQYEAQPFSLTISLGVAACSGEAVLGPSDLIQSADEKMLQAKQEGRNCLRG